MKTHAERLAYQRKWREAHPDYHRNYHKANGAAKKKEYAERYKLKKLALPQEPRDAPDYKKYWSMVILGGIRRRSAKRGWMCDLTREDISIPTTCPVLGIPLEVGGRGEGRQGPTFNSPSVDRIDNALGYVRGNVRIISWRANMLKRDATIEELEKVLAYMRDNEF